mgnify:CR=1 FL=1
MPTYEYECRKCGHTFEKFQSMSDKALKKCPKCAGKLVRLVGAGAGIIFKGSGFYQTDYRSSGYKEASAKDKAPENTSSAGDNKTSNKGKTAEKKKTDKPK